MEYKFDIQQLVSRPFDQINLPSQGDFYEDKTKSLKIRYLSGVEEKVLTSYFMNESGEGLYIVLNNLILDKFDVKDLVLPDLQGIMIFLYSTAFGDNVNIQTKCSHCGYEEEIAVPLSSLKFKEASSEIRDGCFHVVLPYSKEYGGIAKEIHTLGESKFVEIIVKPITFGKMLELKKNGVDIKNSKERILNSIVSIGGNTNFDSIRKFVNFMPLHLFKNMKDVVLKNDIGVDDHFKHSCTRCYAENEYSLNLGHDFLKLPEKHRQNVLEECFLLSHYNEGAISFEKAELMPTSERRWAINRLQEEMAKKKEAEEKAYKSAKSSSGGSRGKVPRVR